MDQLAMHGQLLFLLSGVVFNYNTETRQVKPLGNHFDPTEVILPPR